MGSFKHPHAFDPLDLEIIDRVYEAAWAKLEACEPFRDRERDLERQEALRKQIMACATGHVDFDDLCEKVLATLPHPKSKSPLVHHRSAHRKGARRSERRGRWQRSKLAAKFIGVDRRVGGPSLPADIGPRRRSAPREMSYPHLGRGLATVHLSEAPHEPYQSRL